VNPRPPKALNNLNIKFLSFFVVAFAGCTLIGYDTAKIAEIPSLSAPLFPFIYSTLVTALFTVLLFIEALSQLGSLRESIKNATTSVGAYKKLSVAALAISLSILVLSFATSLMPIPIPHSSLFESTASLVVKAIAIFLIGQQFGVLCSKSPTAVVAFHDFLWPIRKLNSWMNLLLGCTLAFVGWAMLLTGSGSWKYGPVIEDPRFAIPGAMLVFVGTYLMSSCWDVRKGEWET
jgi:hypothetical protein